MAGHDLYETLNLDSSRSCEELVTDLSGRGWGVTDADQKAQLEVAKQVLGNPAKRDMYDKRLADSDAVISVEDVELLASMDVPAGGAQQQVARKKGFFASYKVLTATTAVLAVAAFGVGAAIIFGGDDDEGSPTAADSEQGEASDENGAGAGATGSTPGLRNASEAMQEDVRERQEAFSELTLKGDGDTISLYDYETYTSTSDGEQKKNWAQEPYLTMTVSNPRLVQHIEKGDSSKPDDHPDAADEEFNFLCFDVEQRLDEANYLEEGSAPGIISYMNLYRVNTGGWLEFSRHRVTPDAADGEFPSLEVDAETVEISDDVWEESGTDCQPIDPMAAETELEEWLDSGSGGGFLITPGNGPELYGREKIDTDLGEPEGDAKDGEYGWHLFPEED